MKWTRLAAFGCAAVLCVGCERKAVNDDRDSEGINPPFSQPETTGTSRYQNRDTAQGGAAQRGMPTDVHEFINRASMINMAEVPLGQLASERAQNRDVKQFAQTMIREHTKAGEELKQAVSDQRQLNLPAGKSS